MLYDATMVETIKLALCNIEEKGIESRKVMLGSIIWLRNKYEQEHNPAYLYKAVSHIYAYLELGFSYEDGIEEFRFVLNYLHLDADEVFPQKKWRGCQIKVTKYNIRNLLGSWNPRLQSMKISEVVSDIYENVMERKTGEYLYHCGRLISQDEESSLWEQTYRLYIRPEEAFLYDVNHNRYYIFEQR